MFFQLISVSQAFPSHKANNDIWAGHLATTNVDSSDHFLPSSLACPLLATLNILDQELRSEVSHFSSDTIIEPTQAGPALAGCLLDMKYESDGE